jgi:MYXO-CTERM domain-containing protein
MFVAPAPDMSSPSPPPAMMPTPKTAGGCSMAQSAPAETSILALLAIVLIGSGLARRRRA